MTKRGEKTRNLGTMTEAAYWGFVRSSLRRAFRFWKPAMKAKEDAKRPYKGEGKRQKWEYQCNHCKEWFKGSEIQIDHIIACGSLRCKEDLGDWLERLTPEEGFQVLCSKCHTKKSNEEREARKNGN